MRSNLFLFFFLSLSVERPVEWDWRTPKRLSIQLAFLRKDIRRRINIEECKKREVGYSYLITSDGDYLDLTTLLKQQGLKVLLIYNKDENTSNSLSYNLKSRSKNIYMFLEISSIQCKKPIKIKEKPLMVKLDKAIEKKKTKAIKSCIIKVTSLKF